MSLQEEVKQRLKQGEEATPDTYIELVKDMDELEKLFSAYISLQEEHAPEEKPPPVTPEEFKRYVRRIYDAIKSTDDANDAFSRNKDGTVGKTSAMNYLDGMKMFEIQLVAGRLIKAVHTVQSGTIAIPAWPLITGLKLHKYKTFPERMEKVIRALKLEKSLCKGLFFEAVSMEKRLAMQPEEELKKKGGNRNSNGTRDLQVDFAKKNMPKAAKPGTAGTGDQDEEGEAEDTPARSTKRRRRSTADEFVIINPGARRGKNVKKKAPAVAAASASTNAGVSVQPASPAASTSNNTAGSAQTSVATGTAFVPINAPRSSQPATSAAMSADGPNQTTLFAGPVLVDEDGTAQAVRAEARMAGEELDEKFKFPGPLGKPTAQFGTQVPQMDGPGANQRPLSSSQCLLPQQPQQVQPPSQHSRQPSQPPPDYVTSQQAIHGFQQISPRRDSLPEANQQLQIQGTPTNIPQSPLHRQVPQPYEVAGRHGQQGTNHQHRTSLQSEGQVVNFQKHGKITGSHHGPVTGMRQTNSGSGVVNNYFQLHAPHGTDRFALANARRSEGFPQWDDHLRSWNGDASTRPSSQVGWSSTATLVDGDDSREVHTAVTPYMEDSPPRNDDEDAYGMTSEDYQQMMVRNGLAPQRGGDVHTEEIRMFPANDDAVLDDMLNRFIRANEVSDDEMKNEDSIHDS